MSEEERSAPGDLHQLRRYQRVGADFLVSSRAALLADEMGLGKTVQVAHALASVRADGASRPSLVVVPAALRSNWKRELKAWAPSCSVGMVQGNQADRRAWYQLPFAVLVATFEQIRNDFLINPPDVVFEVLVIDEAQRAKDPTSTTAVALARVNAGRRWLLSATPLENTSEDISTLVRLLDAGALPEKPSIPQIHEALQGRFLRRRKVDVLRELPARIEQAVRLTLSAEERISYDDLWERRGLSRGSASDMLALITQLKQACNFDPATGRSTKAEALGAIAQGVRAEGGKLLVFSQFVESLRRLEEVLSLPTLRYDGTMRGDQRDEALVAFAEAADPVVLLVSLRAGGVGLNIPDATHVVLFDRWWNPAVEAQAIARADRFGRTVPLIVYRFLVEDTIEERIEAVLIEKVRLFEEVVEDAPGAETPESDTLYNLLA